MSIEVVVTIQPGGYRCNVEALEVDGLDDEVLFQGEIDWQGCLHLCAPYVHYCCAADVDQMAEAIKSVWPKAKALMGERAIFDENGE